MFIMSMNLAGFATCMGEVTIEGGDIADMVTFRQQSQESKRYGIFTTRVNYIKIQVRDTATGKILNVIADNTDFSIFLAIEHGLKTDKSGKFIDNNAYIKYRESTYVDHMTKNEGKLFEFDLLAFENLVSKIHFGREKVPKENLENYILIFDQPLSFEQLGVKTEKELLEKYFDFDVFTEYGKLKDVYYTRHKYSEYSLNPSFIATLLDLGYIVGQTDVAPILFIKKYK